MTEPRCVLTSERLSRCSRVVAGASQIQQLPPISLPMPVIALVARYTNTKLLSRTDLPKVEIVTAAKVYLSHLSGKSKNALSAVAFSTDRPLNPG